MTAVELLSLTLVAAAVAATIAQCRVLLRGARWESRRFAVAVWRKRLGWPDLGWDAECDYAGLRALAGVLEAQSADADVRVEGRPWTDADQTSQSFGGAV